MIGSRRIELKDLEQKNDFIRRHIGPRKDDVHDMLRFLGLPSLDALVDKVVPKSIRLDDDIPLDAPMSETDALARLKKIADKNTVMRSLIGMGYYDTITPTVILRNVLENPGWYTAYTPYQPEISQGRLEALLNYQQMIIDLTGLEIANASMLDEATAAAEAMTLAMRVSRSKSTTFLVDDNIHPQTLAVIHTRAEPLGIEIATGDPLKDFADKDAFGMLLHYPGSNGELRDYSALIAAMQEKKIITIMATDLLALTLMKSPGAMGADIAIGSAQRFGVPLGYGGPHAAFFATRDAYKRTVPGRIVGVSVDSAGKPALRLALQTREQHIRREKATSNICTAQVLLANIAGFYAVWHGADGLRTIARRVHRLTGILADGLTELGFTIENNGFFDTITVHTGAKTGGIIERGRFAGFNFREYDDGKRIGISLDEKSTRAEIAALWEVFAGDTPEFAVEDIDDKVSGHIPSSLVRSTDFLSHPTFDLYRSETEMLRYLRRLEQKDIALNRSMIPLGSCTMKLNATTEMIPITWPEFSDIHPFAPEDQAEGYAKLTRELENMLCAITGFAAVSLQPNAGSQGEYAGLLSIRGWHDSRGEGHRDICLIPSSAHGTNPASAVMSGMKVVIVKCDKNGNIDIDDLKTKAEEHKDDLAAIMVTYPSTHGVFEEEIREICDIVHDNGGQVYLDGANLNAMVGLACPGKFGADVAHLNLHKTFCIPHGGGGPGVGPIGVAEHLKPFLPGHPLHDAMDGDDHIGPVSAAPYGSAGILPISWTYIALMGGAGLKRASEIAILNANYIARKLEGHYDTLYKGRNGFVAHECILDTRPFKNDLDISVDDIAKRLMDHGFHAPTMSWPVVHTLMVEPTESESRAELDRFTDAMIAIREEIRAVENGAADKDDNPLKNAPHTMEEVTADDWTHPYSREAAAYPSHAVRADKYWPPVGRVDNAQGDRNLVCTCPPLEDYMEEAA